MLAGSHVEIGPRAARAAPTSSAIDEIVATVFRDHAATLRCVALRSTRDPELAEDVTQEAFLRLLIEAQAGRMPDNIRAWLFQTSSNLIVTRARRTTVARRMAPRLARFDGPAQPDAIALLNEERDELNAVMATLPPAHRIALVMAADGASGAEIAGRLGRTHGATRTLLTRARGRLRAAAMEAA